MLKIHFDEIVDFFVDTSPSRFCRRILHPDERELVDVQTPYLVVSVPFCQYIINYIDLSSSPGCESAEGFSNDVTVCQSTADVIQSQGLQRRDVVLRWEFVRHRTF